MPAVYQFKQGHNVFLLSHFTCLPGHLTPSKNYGVFRCAVAVHIRSFHVFILGALLKPRGAQ